VYRWVNPSVAECAIESSRAEMASSYLKGKFRKKIRGSHGKSLATGEPIFIKEF
jgi:hypothetical protein